MSEERRERQNQDFKALWFECPHFKPLNFFLFVASEAYEKLCTALNKSNLTKAIQQASSVEQTSCLEGYHLVVNQFAPKMLGFSYLGMLCR